LPDNYHFDLTGVDLETCMKIAFANAPGNKAEAWKTEEEGTILILCWSNASSNCNPLPAPMNAEDAVAFVRSWLRSVPYPPRPMHDGDNRPGHRVYNEQWGHVRGGHYDFVAIEPTWLMYGK
jgi:hypothetical protein